MDVSTISFTVRKEVKTTLNNTAVWELLGIQTVRRRRHQSDPPRMYFEVITFVSDKHTGHVDVITF